MSPPVTTPIHSRLRTLRAAARGLFLLALLTGADAARAQEGASRRGSGLAIPNPLSRLFPKREAPPPAPSPRRSEPADLATALRAWPADSLPAVLRVLETRTATGHEGAGVAMALGRLFYLRGEYREAAGAFARAAARLEPARKAEARYRTGLAWLGAGEPAQARAVLEEVARTPSPWQGPARIALASAWEQSSRPDRARPLFGEALETGSGEREPFVLERLAAYAALDGDSRAARTAEERLVREWPRSTEAASARTRLATAASSPGTGGHAVEIGAYLDGARATALANGARRAGFPDARVVSRGEGLAAVHHVWLGTYPDRARAMQAGAQAERALGVSWEVLSAR